MKVTAQLNPNHQLSGSYQNDRAFATGDREYHYTQNSTIYSTGGSLYSGKLNSVWGQNLTSQITVGYNNKGSSDASTYEGRELVGPEVRIHQNAFPSAGRVVGSGRLISGGGREGGNDSYLPSSLAMVRADFTYYKDAWAGSHEFQAGFFGAPRNTYDQITNFINDGFILEEARQIDPNDPSAGTVPFHRQYRDPTNLQTREARERDYALYLQDSWKPHQRLTSEPRAPGRLRQAARQHLRHRPDERHRDCAPRRVLVPGHQGRAQRHPGQLRPSVRAGNGTRCGHHLRQHGADDEIDEYDAQGDGIFETRIVNPAVSASLGGYEFDPSLRQPYVDEFILGFRKQFQGEMAVDVAVINRVYQETYARIDVNGIYPDGPGQPFIGFGRIDPTRGILYQQTNNTWSTLDYTALEITATKNLRNNFQFMAGINKQWQSIQGDWNPTDPARFIQPDTFANNHGLYMPRGNNEDNSLPAPGGTTLTYGPTWLDFSVRLGGTYFAPKGFVVGVSYSLVAGPWSGPVVTRLAATDPDVTRFGPATVPVAGGRTQPNPLNTTIRNAYANRGEGQVRLPAVGTLGVKIGKKINLGGTKEAEISANLMNLLNADGYWQYNYNGASELFNPNYLQPRNQQYPRSLQMLFAFRF